MAAEHQELERSLDAVKGKIEALKNILPALAEREGEIREEGEGVLEQIYKMGGEMMNVLRESERKLSEEAKRLTDAKLEVLSGQAKSAQISLNLLEHIKDYVEESVKTDTPQQVLLSMIEHMSKVTTQINVEELEPKEKTDLILSKDIKSLHHIGDMTYYSCTTLQQCKVKTINHFECIPEEKQVSFSLSIETPDSSLVSVPVSSLKCSLVPVGKGDEPIHTTVTTTSTHPRVYRIHCNPSTRGTHTVKVQVYDVELEDTSLFIPFNPYLDNITRTITELKLPWGVAVSDDGRVIVTENWGHCVTILDNNGKKVKSFGGEGGNGNVQFSYPRGVAITRDNFILVCDDHGIQKISMDGNRIDEEGGEPLQVNIPDGIAISPITGQVYITEWTKYYIKVLNPDLTFSRSFRVQFKNPRHIHIAIDSQGLVYVADTDNHRILKFSPDGNLVAQFGSYGSGPGQLNRPRGITIDTAGTDHVYVFEAGNHRVSVFTSNDEFVSSFGREGSNIDQFYSHVGLAFNNEGLIIICL